MASAGEDFVNDPVNIQQYHFENFGDRDWDQYNLEEHHLMIRMIGFSLFGQPTELITDNINTNYIIAEEIKFGYPDKQSTQINKIYELIKKYHYNEDSNTIIMRIIFIVCQSLEKKEDGQLATFQTPVFVIKKCCLDKNDNFNDRNKCCKIFIDDLGRIYKSWSLYLECNKLPECKMYCPQNGKYSGEIIEDSKDDFENAFTKCYASSLDGNVKVLLEIIDSPACAIGQKILEGTDTAGTVVSVGSTLALVAAIIPGIAVAPAVIATAAVSGAVVGVYGLGRSIANLVDRGTHDQTIGLHDSEARGCWLNAAVGVLGAGTSAATGLITTAARNGTMIGQGFRVTYNTLNIVTMFGSATSLINSGYNMYEKIQNGDKITALEIFQFSTSILFLYKSSIGFKSAETIISETQTATLKNYEDTLRSNRHRKIFRKAQLEARRIHGENAGNAEVISGIRNINDPDNFFAGLVRMNKDFNKSGSRFTITADGKVQINSAHIVNPTEFASLTRVERLGRLSGLPPPQATSITRKTFDLNRSAIYKWFEKYSDSHKTEIGSVALNILSEIMKNGCDIDTFSLLLDKFAKDVKDYLLDLFFQFFISVKDVIADNFKQLFPFVSLPTGVMQFLINIVTEIAYSLKIPLSAYLKTCFNQDGSVSNEFIYMLTEKIVFWITTKVTALKNNVEKAEPFINGFKKKKECTVCKGHYFATRYNKI